MREGEPAVDDTDWSRLVKQLKDGWCTPFLGAGACLPTLPEGGNLSERLANEYGYPFVNDRRNLSRVAQYVATVHDRFTVKKRVTELIAEAGYPDFTSDAEPHALLAQLRLPVYLTTNYDDFMVNALRGRGKPFHRDICRWWEIVSPNNQPAADYDYNPSSDKPIVYHLHGSCKEDIDSLVLTEGDYLDFLINLTENHGNNDNGQVCIPTSILNSLLKPLLFIGYSLKDWTFLVIFHGLLRTVADSRTRRHVSVQLPPELESDDPDTRGRAETYLNGYFRDWKISVYWGDAQEFCAELRARLGEV